MIRKDLFVYAGLDYRIHFETVKQMVYALFGI